MVEQRPLTTYISHIVLILGIILVAFPIWVTFVAATHDAGRMTQVPLPLLPGGHFFENLKDALTRGVGNAREQSVGLMLFNSLIMAMMIAIGKIAISLLSAFAIVYFRFPGRTTIFWLIFLTLMLPVEVRIVPTFEVAARFGMLNSYSGLILPLIASATGA